MPHHVFDDLAAYDDGQLDSTGTARVDAHLAACAECTGALADIRRARHLLEGLPPVAMPADDVARLRERVRRAPPSRVRGALPIGLAASVLVGLGAALVVARLMWPALQLVSATTPVGLEDTARDLHDALGHDPQHLDLQAADATAIRRWLSDHDGPDASRINAMSRDGWPEIQMRGASVVSAGGARVSLVSYEVDHQPVTLLTAQQEDIASAPASAWFAKRVHVHPDAEGRLALSWSTAGQTYAIIAEQASTGLRACLICHSDTAFKQRIDDAMRQVRQ